MILNEPQDETQEESEEDVPNSGAHIRDQSMRKFFDHCSQEGGEFRPMDITVKVPERLLIYAL